MFGPPLNLVFCLLPQPFKFYEPQKLKTITNLIVSWAKLITIQPSTISLVRKGFDSNLKKPDEKRLKSLLPFAVETDTWISAGKVMGRASHVPFVAFRFISLLVSLQHALSLSWRDTRDRSSLFRAFHGQWAKTTHLQIWYNHAYAHARVHCNNVVWCARAYAKKEQTNDPTNQINIKRMKKESAMLWLITYEYVWHNRQPYKTNIICCSTH